MFILPFVNPFNFSPEQIKKTAGFLRQDLIKMIFEAGSGHPAGSLGMADVLATLYFKILSFDPQKPDDPQRDRVILSNGHICPLLYAALARAGFFSLQELTSLRKLGSRLQGHPSKKDLPFIEASSGSLGHGLSLAAGMAYALEKEKKDSSVWCLMSDAEQQEGSTWEAAIFAAKYRLGRLKMVIDYNQIQLSGRVEEVMPIEPLEQKYQAFGWKTWQADGHNIKQLIGVLSDMKAYQEGPAVLLARTIPGKGVSFMEGKWEWHGKVPSKEEFDRALKELQAEA